MSLLIRRALALALFSLFITTTFARAYPTAAKDVDALLGPYATIDAAAQAGLAAAKPFEHRYEYGGIVFAAENGFMATFPVTARRHSGFALTISAARKPVALFHTHPPDDVADFFSGEDIANAKAFGVASYIGVYSSHSIRRFDPISPGEHFLPRMEQAKALMSATKGWLLCDRCF